MIIDTFTGIGTWPFRKLKYASADKFIELMEREGIDQAVVYPITSILAKDCMDGNLEVYDAYKKYQSMVVPFAVINPAFEGWEHDFETCFDKMKFKGLRLFPTYHGYGLTDKCLIALIKAAENKNIPVALAVRVEDERQHHWLMKVPPLDMGKVVDTIIKFPKVRFVISGASYSELSSVRERLAKLDNWHFDIGRMQGRHASPGAVEVVVRAVEDFGADKMLFGSNAPFQYVKSSLLKVLNAKISERDRELILSSNAIKLFK
ncbi:amidohydrolase family protein [bacterium]|nr:amidohydrolase family protein [bacterium]